MTIGIPVPSIDLGAISDQGRVRSRNEDAYGYEPLFDGQGSGIGWIFVVADGVGGENHGDLASKIAVHRVIDFYKTRNLQTPHGTPAEMLQEAIHFANEEVYKAALEMNVAGHMGTTLVAAVLRSDGVLYVGWVGDSRLYVISRRLEKIRQVSRDHTEAADALRQNRITQDQALNHPRRNVLSRSIGGLPDTTPEFAEGTLEATDTVLICSDGLTRYLSQEGILTLMMQPVSSEQIARQLVGAANQLGGKDNITALVVHIGPRESQMETIPPVDTDLDAPASLPPTSESERRPLIDDVQPPENRRRPLLGGLLLLIPLLLIAGLMFATTTQPPPSPTPEGLMTEISAILTEEMTTSPVGMTQDSPFEATVEQTPSETFPTSTAHTAPVIQTQETDNPAALTTEPPPDMTLTATRQPPAAPTTSQSSVIATKIHAIIITPLLSVTVTPRSHATLPAVTPLVVASDTPSVDITSTITVLFAPLIEPYPVGTCLMTVRQAPVYAAVGANAAYTLPAHKVVAILRQGQPSYTVTTAGQNQTYYSVKPNDGSAGAGWINSEDLVPARNLSPEEQGRAFLFVPSTSGTTREDPHIWQPDQPLFVRDSAAACIPMRMTPNEPEKIMIVENETESVLIASSPVSVNGALWWNVRLFDGREGWIRQIYLDVLPTQQQG